MELRINLLDYEGKIVKLTGKAKQASLSHTQCVMIILQLDQTATVMLL